MKEKIYTIPINEAFEQECECPLCLIEKRLEQEAVEYELGAAMMEPDHREESNKKGFCNKHFDMLFASPNKLPLALVLDTHLEEIRKELKRAGTSKKKSLFSKSESRPVTSSLDTCMVCEKVAKTMDRYLNVLLQMWQEDGGFREKFDNSKGFCLPHFERLYAMSNNAAFLTALIEKEQKELEILQADVHKFTLKFDYRNKDMEWGTAKNAPIRAVEKIGGYIAFSNKDN